MTSWVQEVSNYLLGVYKVRTLKNSDQSLTQVMALSNSSGTIIDSFGGGGATGTDDGAEYGVTVVYGAANVVEVEPGRTGGWIQNLSTTTTVYLSFAGAATSAKFKLLPGQSIDFACGRGGPVWTGNVSMCCGALAESADVWIFQSGTIINTTGPGGGDPGGN